MFPRCYAANHLKLREGTGLVNNQIFTSSCQPHRVTQGQVSSLVTTADPVGQYKHDEFNCGI